MNVSESNDVLTVLRWLTDIPRPGIRNERDQAREAAVRLGERAYKTLMSGLTNDEIRQQWPVERSSEDARVTILQLEDCVLASAQLVFDTVPKEPPGLESWYSENLAEMANEITARQEKASRD